MTPVAFALLFFAGIVLAAAACVSEARDATYSYGTLIPALTGFALMTAALTGALY